MLENYSQNDELKFRELSPEEKASRGILGRLYGPIASIVKHTRNGRRYTESLWEKVFANPITQEMFQQGGVPGELDHPVDREETDSSKIAIMMPEAPTKDKNGNLIGYFDIIDTPCGRIAYALAKYGFNLGISSRGTGDTYMDEDGNETVDEDTYSFNAFDLVLLPACKDARLALAESLDTNKVNFKKALKESLENANEEDRKIMTDTLESLNIDFEKPSSETEVEDEETDEQPDAGNAGDDLVKSLQESLIENKRLQTQVVELQEKLSVGYAKEIKQESDITKLKAAVQKLSESANKAAALGNQLTTLKTQLEEQVRLNNKQSAILESYRAKLQSSKTINEGLNNSVSKQDTRINELSESVTQLNESIKTINNRHEKEITSLNTTISGLREELEIKGSQYSKKLKTCNRMVEGYKKVATEALERYIGCKAVSLGVTTNEIKNRLSENYNFDEIDRVCESLRSYKRNVSKLPFNLEQAKSPTITLKEDTSTQRFTNPDDVVDQSLLNLFNM